MPEEYRRGSEPIGRLLAAHSVEELGRMLSPKAGDLRPRVRNSAHTTPDWIKQRWALLAASDETRTAIADAPPDG